MTETAIERAIRRYAIKFRTDTVRQGDAWVELEPTDENLKYTLDRCALPARRSLYPAIRSEILRQRAES